MRNLVFFATFLLVSLLSNRLIAAEVKIYGAGGVQATIGDGSTTLKICPEQSNQLCATLIVENGVIKKTVTPETPATKSNIIEVLFEEYNLNFYYQDSLNEILYGKDILIELEPKKKG